LLLLFGEELFGLLLPPPLPPPEPPPDDGLDDFELFGELFSLELFGLELFGLEEHPEEPEQLFFGFGEQLTFDPLLFTQDIFGF